jgi:hypothetical protein
MSAPALVPSPLYGLRTWSVIGEPGSERLAGPRQGTPWPADGAWLEARCDRLHAAPAPGCECGIHAWHPGAHGARRVLASPREIPGVVEAEGAIELHDDGFRAERARPYALFAGPHANARLARRLADAYGIEAVGVGDADAIVAWCRARGLGLTPDVLERLLGPDVVAAARRAKRRRTRVVRLRIAAAVAAIAVLVGVGLAATGSPGERTLHGRTGEVHVR